MGDWRAHRGVPDLIGVPGPTEYSCHLSSEQWLRINLSEQPDGCPTIVRTWDEETEELNFDNDD